MGTQKILFNIVFIASAFTGIPVVADASKISKSSRISHAKQLMGERYRKSVVRNTENLTDVTEFVEAMAQEWLPEHYSKRAKSLANAIVRESDKHGFDPIFILAVIQNESRFNPEMRGMHTEIGLMQIKPTTAEWIAKKQGLKFQGEKTLLDPVQNVRFGITFLSMLRSQFDAHSPHYIAAYNMGARGVRNVLAEGKTPKDYVQAVMKRYLAIYAAFEAAEDHNDIEDLTEEAVSNVLAVTRGASVANLN